MANWGKQALRAVDHLRRRSGWPAVAVLGLALLLWLVLVAPGLLVPARSAAALRDVTDPAKRHELQDARLKLQNDVRTTLLQAVGGAVVLTGAWVAWRQLHLSREGQITERFTRAIDQLGNTQVGIRLGGIYALERIAKDSTADQATIAEILAAYVRGHAPWSPRDDPPPEEASRDYIPPLQQRAPDVQAALTVLGRMPRPRSATDDRLDLRQTDLRGADLSRLHFEGTNFFGAHLEDAAFGGAHLEGADLDLADLTNATMNGAHLERARLLAARLEGVLFDPYDWPINVAHLDGAIFARPASAGGPRLNAKANQRTRWPAGFDWRAAGVVMTDDTSPKTEPSSGSQRDDPDDSQASTASIR
jgi:pentapeptide repeat protein